MPFASRTRIELALARQAYDAGAVRIARRDLSGFDHLVATRHGLWIVNSEEAQLLAHGLFFGLTVVGDAIYAFEACDLPRARTRVGRLVRFDREGDRIVHGEVLVTGLDNGGHQLDAFDDRLWLVDTANQAVACFDLNGGGREDFWPLGKCPKADFGEGYVHLNSIAVRPDSILLMLHNGADATGRPSEVAVFDRDWRLLDRYPLPGLGCHNFAQLEDGSLLSCGSLAGELIGSDGMRAKVSQLMTRGLAVGSDTIAVGGSPFGTRLARDDMAGEVVFLDRQYKRISSVPMISGPTEIRRLDGRDRSLSAFVAS